MKVFPTSILREVLSSHYSNALSEPKEILDKFLEKMVDSKANKRYEYIRDLGEGGAKTVTLERDSITGRDIAVSSLHEGLSELEVLRFINEVFIIARLGHNNIISVYDFGRRNNVLYYTSQYLKGETLSEYRSRSSPLLNRIKIFQDICDAMIYAHLKGIVHLDIKPSNIYLSEYGEITILDWGLSKDVTNTEDLNVYFEHLFAGSPGYTAPEQINCKTGELDEFSDIYSLGSLFYFILTGVAPWKAQSAKEMLDNALKGEYKLLERVLASEGIPHSLSSICLKAMSLDKRDRYNQVIDLKEDLDSYLHDYPTLAERSSYMKRLFLLFKRHRIFTYKVSIIILIALGVTITYQNRMNTINIQFKKNQKFKAKESYRQAVYLYDNFSFLKSHEALNQIEILNYTDEKIGLLRVKVLMVMGLYRDAKAYVDKLTLNTKEAKQIANSLKTFRTDDRESLFYQLVVFLKNKGHRGIALRMIKYKYSKLASLDEKLNMATKLLRGFNPNKAAEFKFTTVQGKLFFSGSGYLTIIIPLIDLPLHSIDVSNTSVSNIHCLKDMKTLKYLNLSKTYTYNLSSLRGLQLKYLDISHSCVFDIKPLLGTSIDLMIFQGVKLLYLRDLEQQQKILNVRFDEKLYNSYIDNSSIMKLKKEGRLTYEK